MIAIELPDGTKQTAEPGTVEDILRALELNPYEILVLQDDELLLADDKVEDGALLKLVSIVHGG
ncbi:MAG TPA: hypothetical protein O0X42_03550 [Methanocorpusculum sp.]|nr:hypothetical protein [Methanocorpusculum sp.]